MCIVLVHIYWKKFMYKWTCVVQTLVVQGSTVYEFEGYFVTFSLVYYTEVFSSSDKKTHSFFKEGRFSLESGWRQVVNISDSMDLGKRLILSGKWELRSESSSSLER